MGRMDRYEEKTSVVTVEKTKSRVDMHQDLYEDIYLNERLIDLNNLIDNEESSDELEIIDEETLDNSFKEIYKTREYNINKILMEAKENRESDNLNHNLADSIREKQEEITKLIASIEEKEKKEDLFGSLMPDNEETIITDPLHETILDNYIQDNTNNLVYSKTSETMFSVTKEDMENTGIKKAQKARVHRINKTALTIFILSGMILVGISIYIIIINL